MSILAEIRNATLDARVRMRDNTIGTRAEAGKLQIIRVTYSGSGISTIVPASEWMPAADVIAALNAMGRTP